MKTSKSFCSIFQVVAGGLPHQLFLTLHCAQGWIGFEGNTGVHSERREEKGKQKKEEKKDKTMGNSLNISEEQLAQLMADTGMDRSTMQSLGMTGGHTGNTPPFFSPSFWDNNALFIAPR